MNEDERTPKIRRLNHREEPNQNAEAFAGPSNEQPQPKMFKLDIDCFDEIFEYLSVKDLHSFGQTCKTMQQVAGEYFKRNYSAAEASIEKDDIYIDYSDRDVINQKTSISGFNQFIKCIKYHTRDVETLNYNTQRVNEFDSIRNIRSMSQVFDEKKSDNFKLIWPKVETWHMKHGWIYGDFYENLFVHCKNLKCLNLYSTFWLESGRIRHLRVPWFRRQYPKLEHFGVCRFNLIDEIIEFLQNNPNLRSFEINENSIEHYRDELMQSNVQLDLLKVEYSYECAPDVRIASILKELHEKGYYKRLHYHTHCVDRKSSNRLASLPALESLLIREFTKTYNLIQITNMRELAILCGANAKDMDILAKNLVNLQRVFVGSATIDDVLPFICYAPKVTNIKVIPRDEAHFNSGVLRLQTLNKQRGKLNRAQKVTVYVPDNIFLKTKWATRNGDINLSLIEMKRLDSYEWMQNFD